MVKTRNEKSMIGSIVKLIAKNKSGMNAFTILEKLAELDIYPTESIVRVTLANMVKKGYMSVDHDAKCCGCGRRAAEYTLTDAGRIAYLK